MIRIIGDVHGEYDKYKDIIKDCDNSVQLGDFGFNYDVFDSVPDDHYFIPGNHENYDIIEGCDRSLGCMGMREVGGIKFFITRGSVSIDCISRVNNYILTGNKSWWYEEEISPAYLDQAVETYLDEKPNIVMTHDCPVQMKYQIESPNIMRRFGWPESLTCRTQKALGRMFDGHKPKLWLFGHWHKHVDLEINGTRFICIESLKYRDLDIKNGEINLTDQM